MINASSLTPKQRIYLAAAGWLLVLSLCVIFVILPLISQIKNDGQELAQKKQGMELFYADWQVLEKAQKDYRAMQSELDALPAFLPSGEALKFIMMLESFAQATDNNYAVSVVNAPEKKAQTTNLQVSLRGNFPNLMKFLAYLENAPYYNNINSLRSQRLSDKNLEGAAIGDINTTLTISVYQQ